MRKSVSACATIATVATAKKTPPKLVAIVATDATIKAAVRITVAIVTIVAVGIGQMGAAGNLRYLLPFLHEHGEQISLVSCYVRCERFTGMRLFHARSISQN